MPEVIIKKVVAIEYPRQNEAVTSNNYTFHIVAMPGVKKVEVSINGSDWKPCRQAGDSYYYDWASYAPGEYELVARVQLSNGHFHMTEYRPFNVASAHSERFPNGGESRAISQHRAQQLLGRPEMHKHMAHKYVVVVPNQPEVISQLTNLLSQEGVNIDSLLMETLGDIASFRFVLEQENGLRATLESEGFNIAEDKVFRMDLPNRPGELNHLTRRLAEQKVAIRYLNGTFVGKTAKVEFAVDRPEEAISIVKELNQR